MKEGDMEKGRLLKFRKKEKTSPPRPKKSKKAEQSYSGIGVAPKMKTEMLARAQEIEDYINTLTIGPIPHDLLDAIERQWEGLDEYALLNAAENTTWQQWFQSPRTYLGLVKILREKAEEK